MRVFSWNVLANEYVYPDYFPHADYGYLLSPSRQNSILRIISDSMADVITLQEASRDFAVAFELLFAERYSIEFMCDESKDVGILTAVSRDINVIKHERIHVSCDSLITQITRGDESFVVINNHVKWAPDGTSLDIHPGVLQIKAVLSFIKDNFDDNAMMIMCGDFNDAPNGPVRSLLDGYIEQQLPEATSLFGNGELRSLDIIATRGIDNASATSRFNALLAVPGLECPSDHVPLEVKIHI